MTPFTQVELYRLIRRADVRLSLAPRRRALILSALGMCESPVLVEQAPHADADAIGDLDLMDAKWGPSVGIWQCRTLKAETGTGTHRDIERLTGNPRAQAQSALWVYRQQGYDAWTTYLNGAYKAYLQKPLLPDQDPLFPPAPGTHVVAFGEVLTSIARVYDVDWRELAVTNRIPGPAYTIYIGQVLVLPGTH